MKSLFFACLLFFAPFPLMGAFTCVKGKWSPEKYVPILSVQEHYDAGCRALEKEMWEEALIHFLTISFHFEQSPFFSDSLYFSGFCYFQLNEWDLANKQFNKYLNQSGKLKHFEKIFELKFQIAEKFASGKRKHLFGTSRLPKWAPAKKDALVLYDEIIAALPGGELAAQALYCKADMLRKSKEFKESIDSLKTLQRYFPKHSLAIESYLMISSIYLDGSRLESQNPDLLALAELNLNRFRKSFPTEERIEVAEQNLKEMKEIFATSLYDTGRFYEKKKKPAASAIYYRDTILKYPETIAAQKSQERLQSLPV